MYVQILDFYRMPKYHPFGTGTTMAAYVGFTKEKLRDKTSSKNASYPAGINDSEVCIRLKIPDHQYMDIF